MRLIDRIWYGKTAILAYPLLPLSLVFFLLSLVRRVMFRAGLLKTRYLDKPVIVVGNLTAGGTGKTPLVAWLADYLKIKGYKPGLISRGYGGNAHLWPQQVRPDSDPAAVGDEAILLARRTGCPMAVGPDRYQAGKALLDNSDCDILIADDGLQHYALGRDIEIAVIDGRRRFGNGFLLPAGPLREGTWRLEQVDLVITNGTPKAGESGMRIRRGNLCSLGQDAPQTLSEFAANHHTVHAVAGIGNPERFFMLLRDTGLKVIEHPFDDHHAFQEQELVFDDQIPVIMTEKDAVKCQRLVADGYWYLEVSAQPDAAFVQGFFELLEEFDDG